MRNFSVTLIFLIFFTASCGYEPVNKINSLDKISINKKIFAGDKNINRQTLNKLNLYSDTSGPGYTLKLNSVRSIDIISKDKSGNASSYRTTISIEVTLIKDDKIIKSKNFSKSFSYSKLGNKFELKKYQRDIENNLISSIVKNIKIFLKY